MPLPIFATEAEIPEAFRPEYEERDGQWHPRIVSELELERQKRTTLLDEKKEADRKRREAEERAERLAREEEAKRKGITDEELQRIRDAEAEARRPIEEENRKLKEQLRTIQHTDKLRAAAIAAGVLGDRIEDAMLVLERRTTLTDDGAIAVLDADGKVTAKTLQAFLEVDFQKEKPWLYEYRGGSGSGSGRSTGGGGNGAPTPDDTRARKRSEIAGAF
jgi:hypothetical protein